MGKRIDYLDLSKGISIILVVLGHIYSEDNAIKTWLYSFHIPLFFIISGVITNSRKNVFNTTYKGFITSKFRSLMIPYISFCIINLIFNIIVDIISGRFTVNFMANDIKKILLLNGRGAVWFLPCLFIAEIIFFTLIKKCKNGKWIIGISSVLLIIGLFMNVDVNIDSFYKVLARAFIATAFLTVGFYINNFIANCESKILPLSFIIINIILALSNGWVDLYTLQFGSKIIYFVNSIVGTLGIVLLIKNFNFNNKWITFYGRNSLIIMGTHLMLIRSINVIVGVLFRGGINIYIKSILVTIIILFVEIIIINIFNNYLYKFIGRIKKAI